MDPIASELLLALGAGVLGAWFVLAYGVAALWTGLLGVAYRAEVTLERRYLAGEDRPHRLTGLPLDGALSDRICIASADAWRLPSAVPATFSGRRSPFGVLVHDIAIEVSE